METEYNGWTNKATWAVKLHWDNNEGDHIYFNNEALRFKGDTREFADFLQESYEEIFQSVLDGNATPEAKYMVQDVGNGHDVNWDEIAKAYMEEVEENRP